MIITATETHEISLNWRGNIVTAVANLTAGKQSPGSAGK
jgi:hypothetical protein